MATTSIPRGEPLVIQWQAEDVTNLQLLVNETPVADLPPEEQRYTLETDTLEENAVISVVGRGAEQLRPPGPVRARLRPDCD